MMSVVGYPEPEIDRFNKTPCYCSKCGKKLRTLSGVAQYDVYTGLAKNADYLSCPSLIKWHDVWQLEGLGVWVNTSEP